MRDQESEQQKEWLHASWKKQDRLEAALSDQRSAHKDKQRKLKREIKKLTAEKEQLKRENTKLKKTISKNTDRKRRDRK